VLEAPDSALCVAGFALQPQPRVEILDQLGRRAPRPWSEPAQLVTAVLLAPRGLAAGAPLEERTDLLRGNATAAAPAGLALFTDLETRAVGAGGFKLQFRLPDRWLVTPLSSAAFNVAPGPPTTLLIDREPSAASITFGTLAVQPIISLADAFGNRNPDAVPTQVTMGLSRSAGDETPRGYRGGTVVNGTVKSMDGVANFANVQVIGLGSWDVKFEAFLNFRTASITAAQPLILTQLTTPPFVVTLRLDISFWDEAMMGAQLVAAIATIAQLDDLTAVEILGVSPARRRAGGTAVEMSINTPDSAALQRRVADDVASGSSSALATCCAVTGFSGSGLASAQPSPPPPWQPPPTDRHLYIPDETVRVSALAVQSTVATFYGLGVAASLLKEGLHTYWYVIREGSKGSIVGEALAGLGAARKMNEGLGMRAGGAFRTLVRMAQFVALSGEMGGRWGSATRARLVFDLGNTSVYQDLGTSGHPLYPDALFNASDPRRARNESLLDWSLLPLAPRELARSLEWTNWRVNLTAALRDGDVLPRPCDVYAQQIMLGTFGACIIAVVGTLVTRVASSKMVEVLTVRFFGEPVSPDNMHFPAWETVALTWIFTGLSQAAGVGLGSKCGDWVAAATALLLLPVAATVFAFFCVYFGTANKLVRWEPTAPTGGRSHRLSGRWVRTSHDKDYSISAWRDKFYDRASVMFRDLHGTSFAPYYAPFQAATTLVAAITTGAVEDGETAGTVFAAVYVADFCVMLVLLPYRDRLRCAIELLMSAARAAIAVVGCLHLRAPGMLGAPLTESVLFWTSIAGLALACLFFFCETAYYVWRTVARPLLALSSFEAKEAEPVNPGMVVGSIGALVTRTASEEAREAHKQTRGYFLHNQNAEDVHAALEITLEGASGLTAHDLSRNAAVCLVKMCGEHLPHYENRSGREIDVLHGDTVYQTRCGGHTLTPTSAWWNETFCIPVRQHESFVAFYLWEIGEGNHYRDLGHASFDVARAMEDLRLRPARETLAIQVPVVAPPLARGAAAGGKDALNGRLALQLRAVTHALYPLNDSRSAAVHRASRLHAPFLAVEPEARARERHAAQRHTQEAELAEGGGLPRAIVEARARAPSRAPAGEPGVIHGATLDWRLTEGGMGTLRGRALPDPGRAAKPLYETSPPQSVQLTEARRSLFAQGRGDVEALLVLSDNMSGQVVAMEPRPELALPESWVVPAAQPQEEHAGPRGVDAGWAPAAARAPETMMERAGDDLDSATAGRPRSLAIGAGAMRRELLDEGPLSSAALAPLRRQMPPREPSSARLRRD